MKAVIFQSANTNGKMFAAAKFKTKAKPPNSRNQFVAELNASGQKMPLKRSFDTAQKLLQTTNARTLKQTKLCLSRPNAKYAEDDEKPSCSKATTLKNDRKPAPEFFLMPMPKAHNTTLKATTTTQVKNEPKASLNKTVIGVPSELHPSSGEPQSKPSSLLAKTGRSMLALVGQVDFCLKMHKVHPELSALWDVYGKLQKIIKSKLRGEYVLLLRNASGGPILQSIYYDFNNHLQQFEIGCSVRAVGRFVGENRLHTFKLQQIDAAEITQQTFMRIQNVTSYVLLQNKIQHK